MTEQEKHADVYAALLAAQAEFTTVAKDAENSHFKNRYATLKADFDAALPALHRHGIVVSQPLVTGEFGHAVETILRHPASNTDMKTTVPLLMGKQSMQDMKSASTYARRIGFENLTGLVSGEDDDAETDRKGNDMGAALTDAWRQSVMDSLPGNATPRQTAEAFADAICADFAGKKERALQNRWRKHEKLVAGFEQRFPDLHSKVVDAFETQVFENDTPEMPRIE